MNIVIGLESTFFIFDPIIFLFELIETPISLTACTNFWKETSYLISKKYSRIFSLVLRYKKFNILQNRRVGLVPIPCV